MKPARLAAALSLSVLFPAALAAQSLSPGWAQLSPSPAAPALSGSALAWDPVGGELVLFGGDGSGGYSSGTWTFDGAAWTQRNPPVHPTPRTAAAMAFDAVTGKVVLFGGFGGGYLGDTVLWDGATGTGAQATPAHVPTAVTGPSLFTDPLTGEVVQFGGFSGQFYQLTTYRWSGGDWQALAPAHTPGARAAAVAARDETHGKVLLFAGLASVNPWNTWLWDGVDWQLQSPSQQPPNRFSSAAAWDPQLGGVVMFGGGSAGGDLRDTWLWTGGDWVELLPAAKPAARESHAMAYDPTVGRVLVVGGEHLPTHFADTWSLVEPGHFESFGQGVGGAAGVPALSGTGDLTPGSGIGATLELRQAPAGAPVVFLLGTTQAALPLAGATLYVHPVLVRRSLVADGAGVARLSFGVPPQIPGGFSFYAQVWTVDPGAPAGFGASNGLRGTVP